MNINNLPAFPHHNLTKEKAEELTKLVDEKMKEYEDKRVK